MLRIVSRWYSLFRTDCGSADRFRMTAGKQETGKKGGKNGRHKPASQPTRA